MDSLGEGPIKAAIITVSGTHTEETDKNDQYLKRQLWAKDAETTLYAIIPDEPEEVARTLDAAVDTEAQIILVTGGTEFSSSDAAIDVIQRKLEKELPAFGEIYRQLSHEQIASPAIFLRATAGLYRGAVVICVPAPHSALTLAWEKLIGTEFERLAGLGRNPISPD